MTTFNQTTRNFATVVCFALVAFSQLQDRWKLKTGAADTETAVHRCIAAGINMTADGTAVITMETSTDTTAIATVADITTDTTTVADITTAITTAADITTVITTVTITAITTDTARVTTTETDTTTGTATEIVTEVTTVARNDKTSQHDVLTTGESPVVFLRAIPIKPEIAMEDEDNRLLPIAIC